MSRRRALVSAVVLISAVVGVTGLMTGCTGDGSSSPTSSGATPPEETSAAVTPTSRATTLDPITTCVAETVQVMTERERVGQLLMVGLNSGGGVGGVEAAVTTDHVGGVILLGGWTGAARVRHTTEELEALAGTTRLFLAADQEGGAVQQLKGAGFGVLPSATEQAAMSPVKLRSFAEGLAADLAAAGINVNLAPVADTVPTSVGTANAPIGAFHREYGSTPEAVAPNVVAFIEGMHAGGVAATIKHFPGLGRITGNTDVTATGITDSVATSDDPYLAPFAAGIRAGTDFVMVGSARYPKIDAENQALFSSTIVTDLLRTRLSYDGVVITDDVGAAASVQDTPVGQRATRFIAAGGDVVLTAQVRDIPVMAKAIRAQMREDAEFAEQVEQSVLRVLTLKANRDLLACS